MTLKWKIVRTFLLLAALILGVSTVFIYLSVIGSTPTSAAPQRISKIGPPSPRIAEEGQEVSLEEA